MFTKDLRGNVTLFTQIEQNYCGPACAEMVRGGYPNAADRLPLMQPPLWNKIQMHNSKNETDAGKWHTDPHGLTGCLQSLNNPPKIHWVEFSDSDKQTVLLNILRFINSQEFPTPVIINGGEHWVVV